MSDNVLSSNAFSGSTTLPVSTNSSTKITTAIRPSTGPSDPAIAATLSLLAAEAPVINTDRPPGPPSSRRLVNWFSAASENSGAVPETVRYALPSRISAPVATGPT